MGKERTRDDPNRQRQHLPRVFNDEAAGDARAGCVRIGSQSASAIVSGEILVLSARKRG